MVTMASERFEIGNQNEVCQARQQACQQTPHLGKANFLVFDRDGKEIFSVCHQHRRPLVVRSLL